MKIESNCWRVLDTHYLVYQYQEHIADMRVSFIVLRFTCRSDHDGTGMSIFIKRLLTRVSWENLL